MGHHESPTHALDDAESSLQAAILTNDADAIRLLLHERVIYVSPDGATFDREADLDAYRSGVLRIERCDELARHTFVQDDTGATFVDLDLAGSHGGNAFAMRARYSRTWVHDTHGWRVLAATSGPLASS